MFYTTFSSYLNFLYKWILDKKKLFNLYECSLDIKDTIDIFGFGLANTINNYKNSRCVWWEFLTLNAYHLHSIYQI